MVLKYKCKTREEIPVELQPLYVEREGAFYLDADGMTEKSKVDEFRESNVALKKELDDFKLRFEGIDPEEVRRLAEEKRRLEEEQQLKAGEVDKVIEARLKEAQTAWDKQSAEILGERDALTMRLTAIQIDQGVITSATKRGLRATAIPDITARARAVFKLVNGVPQAFEADGKAVRYAKDGATPMTLEEWVDAQVSEAPHLFESNAGSGAVGNPAGGGTGSQRVVKNPFRKDTWNLTEQMKLQKSDPSLAARLKAAA
jgi:hypothetical protein